MSEFYTGGVGEGDRATIETIAQLSDDAAAVFKLLEDERERVIKLVVDWLLEYADRPDVASNREVQIKLFLVSQELHRDRKAILERNT